MSKTEDVYEAVLHDKDDLAHYGRLGMKWYQHIFGEYQGAAKYAEKGVKKLEKAKERDRFNGGTQSEKTKQLANKVKAGKAAAKEAKQRKETAEKEKKAKEQAENVIKEKQAKEQAAETARQKAESDKKAHEQKILDLAQGKADWRNATASELQEAIGRLTIEKQYKQLRDEVSGAKVVKDLGKTAADSVARKSGDILNSLLSKSFENWQRDVDFERQKKKDEYNDSRKAKNKKAEAEAQKEADKKSEAILSKILDISRGKGYKDASTVDLKAATERLKAERDYKNMAKESGLDFDGYKKATKTETPDSESSASKSAKKEAPKTASSEGQLRKLSQLIGESYGKVSKVVNAPEPAKKDSNDPANDPAWGGTDESKKKKKKK